MTVYVPKMFEETDLSVLHALMRAHPLGTWVTRSEALVANHVPFFVDTSRGLYGTLMCHVARANPVWKTLSGTTESLVIFQGAEAYITPSWYLSKTADGKVVPTWNYVVVHAEGAPQVINDREWLLAHLHQLTGSQEASEAEPWQVTDAPTDYIDRMIQGIVGIEIPITRIVGKWKVSQNRTDADKLRVAQGLHARGDTPAGEMAGLVAKHMTSSTLE